MKLLITGSGGVIGTVLRKSLDEHHITHYDLPDFDVRNYSQLQETVEGHDVVIHLAWNLSNDNYDTDQLNHENTLKTFNVYRAASEAGVKRVIMASSVHADKYTNREIHGLLDPYALPLPDSPYGAGKCMMESLGRYYADAKGLEVVCIRFGGVNPENIPPQSPESERIVWLSHGDCSRLVEAYLGAEQIPYNFEIAYAVSDNEGRVHDTKNSVGWTPQDGSRA